MKLLQSSVNSNLSNSTNYSYLITEFARFHIKTCASMYYFIRRLEKRNTPRNVKDEIRKLISVLLSSPKFNSYVLHELLDTTGGKFNFITEETLMPNINWHNIVFSSVDNQVIEANNYPVPSDTTLGIEAPENPVVPSNNQDISGLFDDVGDTGLGIRKINGGSLNVDNYSVRDLLPTKALWKN